MKAPADYLPQPLPHDTGPVVTYQAALDGIQAALEDAETRINKIEKYHELLKRALCHAR